MSMALDARKDVFARPTSCRKAAAKGGTTRLEGVYKYAEPVTAKGFVFIDSPGYDPASVTGEVASGANLVCFTTGRGSSRASSPRPRSSSPPTRRCTGAWPTTWM